jgi:hypothetical protein
VAGAAALVWGQCPGKTVQEIRQVLESTAQDLGPSGRDNKFGHGLVRADLAYNSYKDGGGNVDLSGTYFIRSTKFGTHIHFQNNGNLDMTQNQLSHEQIEIKTLGNDKYSLKSKTHDEMYLRVPGAGADVLAITQMFVGDQEQFYILRYSTGKYTIKSAYFGNYIRGKTGEDIVTQTCIGIEEQFDLIPIN